MNAKEKKNIRLISLEEIIVFLKENNEKTFRAKQIYEWLWKKAAHSFDEMTNLSINLRKLLDENFFINSIKLHSQQKSSDGTMKFTFELNDGELVEGVLIPSMGRATACISSQVGCNLGCEFCATAKIGFKRNLSFEEIYDQVVCINKQAIENYKTHLTNIVYMGMGEPLLNYDNVLKSINIITSTEGMAMSPSRITVSTVGIPKMIKKLADDETRFNLALSLHTANDKLRSSSMPVNDNHPTKQLIEALKYYHTKTSHRISIEYILFKDYNDGETDAQELAIFCRNFPVKVNIIEYNNVDDTVFQPASKEKTEEFVQFLESKNMIVNVRKSRGKDIDAACGQLANKLK
ncbi:23S rRNA (adenine(2503)-C(2))-methyltransferase RlmN [Bacteroidota bacterium]